MRSGLGTLTYRDGRIWVGTWLAGQKETGRYINKSTGHQHSAHAASQNAIAKTSDPVDDAIEAMNSAVPMQNSGAPAGKNANAPAAADPVDDAIEAMNTGVPMKNTGANPAPHAQLAPSGKQ